jgi:serine/threonine-protein kinase
MAPEQMRASSDVDHRADIWSLGCILFELLTGTCPFDGDSLAFVCARVLNDPPPLLRDRVREVPERLDAIVNRCLEKDPDRRFDDVGQLAAALKDFASAEGQRCAERSLRVASGINLKSDRPPARTSQPSLPAADPAADSSSRHLVRVLTPASQHPAQHGGERGVTRRLFGLAACALAATVVLALGGAFWSYRARAEDTLSLHSALPALPPLTHSAPPSDAAPTTHDAQPVALTPAPSVASTASAQPAPAPRASVHRLRPTTTATPRSASTTRSVSSAAGGAAESSPPAAPTTTAVTSDLDRMGGRY